MKTFELTARDRGALVEAIQYILDGDMTGSGVVLCTRKELETLRDKLKPKRVKRGGWLLKDQVLGVWHNVPRGEEDQFQYIEWEVDE